MTIILFLVAAIFPFLLIYNGFQFTIKLTKMLMPEAGSFVAKAVKSAYWILWLSSVASIVVHFTKMNAFLTAKEEVWVDFTASGIAAASTLLACSLRLFFKRKTLCK